MSNDLVISAVKKELRDFVYPDGYNQENAISTALKMFKSNSKIEKCTFESKKKCLLDMLVQGLNPLKGQCSFVPFYSKAEQSYVLQLFRHYSGSIMVAKRCDSRVADIRAQLVRDGDVFEFSIDNGLYTINAHRPTLESLDSRTIAAYAIAVDKDNNALDLEIMTRKSYIEHIKKTAKPINGKEPVIRQDGSIHPKSMHYKQPEIMFKKTVIHKLCRQIIKCSPNEEIARIEEEIIDNDDDNTIIDIKAEDRKVIDFKPKEEPAPDQTAEPIPMATMTQAETITKLSAELNQNEKMMANICGYFEADIKKISELTEDQATEYIEILKEEIKSNESNPGW